MRVDRGFAKPILACGAQLKNTFCLASGDRAWLGPHIGDLDNLETYDAYVEAIARLERFLGVRPAVIAHDLHPDYLSTAYARQRPGGGRRSRCSTITRTSSARWSSTRLTAP